MILGDAGFDEFFEKSGWEGLVEWEANGAFGGFVFGEVGGKLLDEGGAIGEETAVIGEGGKADECAEVVEGGHAVADFFSGFGRDDGADGGLDFEESGAGGFGDGGEVGGYVLRFCGFHTIKEFTFMEPLKNKTSLIVGASRGIGLAIAKEIATQGAHTILASRNIEALEAEAAALAKEGKQASALKLDVNDAASIAALPDVDILVNVTGTNIRKAFEHYTKEDLDFLMQTNLLGLTTVTQKVGGRMKERGTGGKIVFIGSLMSLLGLPYLSVYAMTKSALAGLTRVLAAEWGRYNIQVNCIAPGFILTDLNRQMWQAPEMKNWLAGAQANPRMGTPEDIAPMAAFLCGPGADYITGQVIAIDGGYTTTAVWPFGS